MYQYSHKMFPDLFQDYFSDSTSSHSYTTRCASKNSLLIPRYTTTRTQQSFKYIGAKIWNDIPQAIRHYSYPKFKRAFKLLLLKKYKWCKYLTFNY